MLLVESRTQKKKRASLERQANYWLANGHGPRKKKKNRALRRAEEMKGYIDKVKKELEDGHSRAMERD
jgi:hypothetical protein